MAHTRNTGGVVICEPSGLYNMLNQYTNVSKLAEINYLYLLGEYYCWCWRMVLELFQVSV